MSATALPSATVILPAPYDHDVWLDARTRGVGGSDAATIVGANPYNSAYALWLDKTGGAPAEDFTGGPEDVRWWGHILEDDIAYAFECATGLTTGASPGLLANTDHPWRIASLDRLVYRDGHLVGLLEIKTTGLNHAAEWDGEQVPAPALLQIQHYLMVTGLPCAWVAALIAGQRFVHKQVPRDDDLIGLLAAAEATFWRAVCERTPPPVDGSAATGAAIKRQYPIAADDQGVLLAPDEVRRCERITQLDTQIKTLQLELEEHRQAVQLVLGEHPYGYDGERQRVRWTTVERTPRVDAKALAADHPDLARQYMATPEPYRRFTLVT